jgi:hypothetical protein
VREGPAADVYGHEYAPAGAARNTRSATATLPVKPARLAMLDPLLDCGQPQSSDHRRFPRTPQQPHVVTSYLGNVQIPRFECEY